MRRRSGDDRFDLAAGPRGPDPIAPGAIDRPGPILTFGASTMNPRLAGLVAGLFAWMSVGASAQSLKVGDPAPELAVSKFLKGDAVASKLDPKGTYVVEFWATWCPPCRTSIPHLTGLQKQYQAQGLKIIGVSVFERNPKAPEPFVKAMGDKMDYTVALDDVPEGKSAGEGKMAESWMKASESEGIPTAFIVREAKVIWIGHPMQIDDSLRQAMAADFDLNAFVTHVKEEKAIEAKVIALMTKLQGLGADADPKDQLDLIDQAIALKPASEKGLGFSRYMILFGAGDPKASDYGTRLVDTFASDNAEMLNAIAWANVDPDAKLDKAKRDVPLAIRAARKAVDLTKSENGAVLDTLAVAVFASGDAAEALKIEEQALKAIGDDDNAEVKARVEQYRKAARDKAKP